MIELVFKGPDRSDFDRPTLMDQLWWTNFDGPQLQLVADYGKTKKNQSKPHKMKILSTCSNQLKL